MPGASVLVIDDSPTILKLVQLVLTKTKYRVITASSAEVGLVAAKEARPALILLDSRLPDLDGRDLCGAMSADTVLSSIPVVMMCGKGEAMEDRFAGLGNVADTISKPFSPEALLAVIDHAMDRRTRNQDSRAMAVTATASAPRPRIPAPSTAPAPGAEPDRPALSGDLTIISIADVLSLLADQGQTGVLSLSHADIRLETYFLDGRIAFATAVGAAEEFLLGRFLVDADAIDSSSLKAVLDDRAAGRRRATLLGADLVERALVTPAGLKKAMAQQTAALVYEGLRWGSGRFWFVQSEDLPDVAMAEEASAALPVDGLLMEGFRRVDEWRLIEREIGDFDRVFVRNDGKLAAFGRGKLTREEQTVLEFVNGKNSIKDVIYRTSMGSFDVTKMLYRLLRTKLIRHRVGPMAV